MMTKWTSGSSTRFHPCFPHFVGFVLAFLVLETTSLTVHSQTPITPSGLNTGVNLSPTPPPGKVQYDITGGTRPGGGVNLFHSFGEFGVPTTNIANFLNDSGLQTANILGRITGGNVSSIFGTIQTTGFGAANLFLMNPAGFLFGPNATVNIGGMMTFTTADYLTLRELDGSNAGAFHADPAQTSMLTSAPVAAFGFIGSNPNAITFEGGQLTVVEGTGLALVGGNINVLPDTSGTPSGITAPGRAINIASVGGSGEVGVDTVPQTGMLLGTITLGQGTTLSTVGDPSFGDGSGGEVFIRGGQLVATLATIITSPAEGSTGSGGNVLVDVSSSGTLSDTSVMTNSLFAGAGGSVSITARAGLTATNTIIDTTTLLAFGNSGETTLVSDGQLSMTDSTINTRSDFSGNGGHVTITGMEVTLGGTHIITDVFTDPSFGPDMVSAGAVTITGHESATISGMDSTDPIITSTAMGTLLDAGSILITSKTVNLSTGLIDAGVGDGGIITPSNGGTIEVRGNRISLSQFQLTSTSSGFQESTGAGGTIRLRGADNLGAESVNLSASRLSANATTGGGGGNIEFHTRQLTASEQTQITTSSFNEGAGGAITVRGAEQVTIESESRVLTDVVGIEGLETRQGTAGNILVETQSLNVLTGGQIRASALPSSTGNAGNITVHGAQNVPAQSVLIDGFGSGVFTDTQGTGAGGSISVNANTVTLSNGGTLSATTSGSEPSATGGTITVDANQVILGNQSFLTASTTGAGQGGTIVVTADTGISLLGNSSITSTADATGDGGFVQLRAPTITMEGSEVGPSNIVTSTRGEGNAGNIELNATELSLAQSFISARTEGPGQAGSITIQGQGGSGTNASDVTLSGSQLVTETFGDGVTTQGNAGSILIKTARLSLKDVSQLNTASRGSTGIAGNIILNATEQFIISSSIVNSDSIEAATGDAGQIFITSPSVLIESNGSVSTSTEFTGNAGNITVNTNSLQITSGGKIASSSTNVVTEFLNEFPELAEFFPITGPAGKAGTVTVQDLGSRAESVLVDGVGSGMFTETKAEGEGGNIFVNANSVMLQNGGTLSAATSGTEPTAIGGTITIDANQVQVNSGSLITASTTGAGAGGSVNINAASTFASNAGMVSSTATQATGGDINITSGQSVTLDNGSLITASSTGEGNAGNIVINAGQSYTSTNSSVTTKAEQASGGNISVLATGLVQLTNSELNASVQGSSTTVGGNILIDPLYVILQNSKIVATATQGQGGNINIFYTGAFLADPSTVIDASSQFGQSGTVTIQSPISPASGKIIPIGQKPLIATSLFSQRCAALAGGNISSFTVAGRDTLPSEPGDWLSTPVALAAPGPGVAQEAKGEGDGSHQIDEIDQTNQTNEFPLLSLRQIAPLGFLIQTFAIDDTDCRS